MPIFTLGERVRYKVIVLSFFSLLICICFGCAKGEIAYDTLGGVTVTKENLLKVVKKTPAPIVKKVKDWFGKYPDAYSVLLKQGDNLEDLIYLLGAGDNFFKTHKNLTNLSPFNYVFYLPGEDFIIKISGPQNRFHNTLGEECLGAKRF